MHAQVVTFKTENEVLNDVQSQIERWKHEVGRKLNGAKQIITCFEKGGSQRCAVVVLFDTEEALNEFSNNDENLNLFEDSKKMLSGLVQYYDAEAYVSELV